VIQQFYTKVQETSGKRGQPIVVDEPGSPDRSRPDSPAFNTDCPMEPLSPLPFFDQSILFEPDGSSEESEYVISTLEIQDFSRGLLITP